MHKQSYPFTAVVGQERMKRALIYTLIVPEIGGVVLSGEKGTGKSTLVRGLAEICEKQKIELPLNTTEDMLVGSMDFETALQTGARAFSPGILQRAHQNLLYVDEINLLKENLTHILIDVVAGGVNRMEREGIRYTHPCETVLVGSMNPEEGPICPQLLDRFGLFVSVTGESEVQNRAEIIKRRLSFEKDPKGFCQSFEKAQQDLKQKIKKAQERARYIKGSDEIWQLCAMTAEEAGAQGNRCEIVLFYTAMAVAAFAGRDVIYSGDLKEAATYVLPHRKREQQKSSGVEIPKESAQIKKDPSQAEDQSEEQGTQPEGPWHQNEKTTEESPNTSTKEENMPDEEKEDQAVASSEREAVRAENIYEVMPLFRLRPDRNRRIGSGRRMKTKTDATLGQVTSFTQTQNPKGKIAFAPTLRAAAPYQKNRKKDKTAFAIRHEDIRYQKRETHIGATVIFVVDASGSMGAQKRMKETKEAVLSMLQESYQKRDKVAFIAFRKEEAQVLLDVSGSAQMAHYALQSLPTGGKTPLAAGLFRALGLIKGAKIKDKNMVPLLILVTDGRSNVSLFTDNPLADALYMGDLIAAEKIAGVVIDTEGGFIRAGIAKEVAAHMGADYYKVTDLRAEGVQSLVQRHRPGLD